MGITIVGIDEKDGKHIVDLLEEMVKLDKQILERVKRIPGKAASLQFILGIPKNQ